MIGTAILLFLVVFLTTYVGVGRFRIWSLRKNILDIPNERSSHLIPTPRGAGIIIGTVTLAAYLLISYLTLPGILWSYLAGAILVCGISLLDDLKKVAPILRFICHSAAAALVIWELGSFERVAIPVWGIIELGQMGYILTFLWIVWVINAYNFMDGIDGLAGIQALSTGLGWGLFGILAGNNFSQMFGGVLFVSAIGFLWYNWSPAKVFLGDVGSAFWGFTFAVLPLIIAGTNSKIDGFELWLGVLSVWFFVFDSIVTLISRIVRRQKIWKAHREHIYQRLIIEGLSHRFVTLIYGCLSVSLMIFAAVYFMIFDNYVRWILLTLIWQTGLLLALLLFKLRLKRSGKKSYLKWC